MEINLRAPEQEGLIVHPNPELSQFKVAVTRPTEKELMEWEDTVDRYTVREMALNPTSGKPYRDANGNALMKPARREVPGDVTLQKVADHVKRIEGFGDAQFDPKNVELTKDMLRKFLYDRRFNFSRKEMVFQKDDDGNEIRTEPKVEKEVDWNFFTFITNQLFRPETYGDPLESNSASTATDATA